MELDISTELPSTLATPLLVVALPIGFEVGTSGLDGFEKGPGEALDRGTQLGDFLGRTSDQLLVHRTGPGPERILFLGIGEPDEVDSATLRALGGRAVRAAEKLRIASVALSLAHLSGSNPLAWGQWVAEGMTLASWRFDELQAEPEEPKPPVIRGTLVVDEQDGWDEGIRLGAAFGEGENLARTLQARPGNVATPTHLAEEATRIAGEVGLEVEILGPEEIEAEGMKALLSVTQGSDQEPRLIVLRHRGGPDGGAPLVLVGKGLTFDAGGISIKPAKGMEEMKYDMSGGAAVLGAMLAIGRLGLPANVTAIVPSSENLINGSATKPGDVIGSRAGKTIEVINTDAEGRLILADALHYATEMNPAAIIDCATLTGACVIALGHHRSALLGNNDDLARELEEAGDRAGEPCWRLPIGPEYKKQLKSDFADLKNVGGRPAGSITAACFLAEFVGDHAWAHLDVAGTAYGETEKPYLNSGPLGVPCRLLLEWVRGRGAA